MENNYSKKLEEYLLSYAKQESADLFFTCEKIHDVYTVTAHDKNSKKSTQETIPIHLVDALFEKHEINAQNKILGIIFKPGPKCPHL